MRITLDQVTKSFGRQPVISDLTLAVESGTIMGLLGPSGSGKTTAIRLMLGAIAADHGTIAFDDITVPELTLLSQIGFMPQDDALYADLTGIDNLRFFAGLHGLRGGRAERAAAEALDLLDLAADRKKYVRDYSGGMKKRLSLAAALLHEPAVLLLDEPTVGIDPVLRRVIWNRFQDIKRSGRTIVVSTHVMDEVTECDTAALLYHGRLLHHDTVPALLTRTSNGRIEDLFFAAEPAAADPKGGDAPC